MQLPNIDRTALRPAGAEVVAPAPAKVIPVAPVNPSKPAQEPPGVVNNINPPVQARATEAASRVDPLQGGSQADNSAKGWTQRQESVAAKPEAQPPKEPLSKMLLDHIHSVWSASARVVEIWMQNNPDQNQTDNQNQNLAAANRKIDPLATPGVIAKEVLTYSPTQIRKTEKPE